ncbi:hypothetical protein QUA13_02950 [Microcoleus sp. S28C3]|uniref:hypothetical protein n=1 Tax=Microcoleus sp. S28C3 TaxID=3055414 RepID=UPI002FD2924D
MNRFNGFNGWMLTEEGRRKKEEGRRKKEEGRGNFSNFKITSFLGTLRGFN